jgi:uncharacterized protein (TIGR02246 family)
VTSDVPGDAVPAEWVDKLAIREVLERYMRYNDDGDAVRIAELFDEDAAFQVMGSVVVGRDAIRAGRYPDRLRRHEDGRWLITCRTGVSVARPGEAGTDAEWQRALTTMPEEERRNLRQ